MAKWKLTLEETPDVNQTTWLAGGDVVVKAQLISNPKVEKEFRIHLDPSRPQDAIIAAILAGITAELKEAEEYFLNIKALPDVGFSAEINI